MTTINTYFTLPPDWSAGVILGRAWRTGVQRSVTGAEKRSRLLTWIRRSLQYSLLNTAAGETNYLQRKLFAHLHQVFGLPLWSDGSVLTAQAAAGTNILNVDDTRYRDFSVGQDVILIDHNEPESYEIGEIQSKTQTSITLVNNLTYTWPADYWVYPVLAARIDARQQWKNRTDGLSEISIRAVEAFE